MMLNGGFPQYMLGNPFERNEINKVLQIRSDIDSVLGSDILAGEKFDQGIAKKILHNIITCPGKTFNASKLGRDLGFDKRTIERYVSIFKNRFLIHSLANLKQQPHAQKIARAKIHPVDTSFSIAELIASGIDIREDPPLFGEVLESYAVNQIISSAQSSDTFPEYFYWRDSSSNPKEVDLVLVQGGQKIGIEIKGSTKVSPNDFRGLKALDASLGLEKGFVFYLGNEVIKRSDHFWALPISALWSSIAFNNELEEAKTKADVLDVYLEGISAMLDFQEYDANLFLSYNHNDNEHLDNRIVGFVNDVAEEYEFTFGRKLKLFIDKDSINWGEDWRAAIDKGLDDTHFIIPAVTPRYLTSNACRSELFSFVDYSRQSDFQSVLPLVWQQPNLGNIVPESDFILKLIDDHHYIDVSELRDLTSSDSHYKEVVRNVVKRLRAVIEMNQTQVISSTDTASAMEGLSLIEESNLTSSAEGSSYIDSLEDDEDGFVELMERFVSDTDKLTVCITKTGNDINAITKVLNENKVPPSPKKNEYSMWSMKIAEQVEKPRIDIEDETAKAEKYWSSIYDISEKLIVIYDNFAIVDDKNKALDSFRNNLIGFRHNLDFTDDTSEFEASFNTLASLSVKLRPLSKAVRGLLNMYLQIALGTDMLIERIEKILDEE